MSRACARSRYGASPTSSRAGVLRARARSRRCRARPPRSTPAPRLGSPRAACDAHPPKRDLRREKTAASCEHRHERGAPTACPISLDDGGLGSVDRLLGGFEVDPSVVGQLEMDLAATAQDVVTEHRPQAREERAQGAVGTGRRAPRPQRFDQRLAPAWLGTTHGEVGEQNPRLTAREFGRAARGRRARQRVARRAGFESRGCRPMLVQGESQNVANRPP